MSTVKGFGQLGNLIDQQCGTFSKNLLTVEAAGTRQVAAATVAAVATNLGGQKIRMSGVGRKGANVSVVALFTGKDAVVKMNGPAHLIERDTKAHQIPKNRRRTKRRGNPKAIRIGTQWVTGPVDHPGTKGKHPFEKGVRTVRPLAPRIYQRGVNAAMRRSFK